MRSRHLSPRAWSIADVVVAVLLAATAVVTQVRSGLNQGWTPWPVLDAVLVIGALVGQSLPLAGRRRHPVAMFLLALVFTWAPIEGGAVLPGAIAVTALTYTVAVSLPWRASWPIAVLGGAVSLAQTLVLTDFGWHWALSDVLYYGFIWGVAHLIRFRRRRHRRSRTAQATAALADERARIARELHDVVAHHVSGIVVQAGAARTAFRDDPVRAGQALDVIDTVAREARTSLGRLIGVLRHDQPDAADQPRLAHLPALLAQVRRAGLPVDWQETGRVRPLPAETDLFAYRIVQEALTNCVKHSHARQVRVVVEHREGSVAVRVDDDGPGGPARLPEGGHGLVGMRERVALLGGTLVAGPRPGGGWTVDAVLPVGSPDEQVLARAEAPAPETARPAHRFRPPWFDVVLTAVLVTLLVLLDIAEQAASSAPVPWSVLRPDLREVAACLLLAAVLPVCWRRRAPMTMFAVALAARFAAYGLHAISGIVESAWLILLYTVTTMRRLRWSVTAVAVSLGVSVVTTFVEPVDGTHWQLTYVTPDAERVGGVLVWPAIQFAAVWGVGLLVRHRRRRARERAEHRAQAIVADERQRIAHELQDVVAAQVEEIVARSGNGATAGLAEIEATAREALIGMRRLVGMLRRVGEHAPQPGLGQLDDLLAGLRRGGRAVGVRVEGPVTRLPADVDLIAYRIIQEALTPAVASRAVPAPDDRAEITVTYHADAVLVRIDGSAPADGDDRAEAALIGMRERAALLGGECRTETTAAGGRLIACRLPLDGGVK